MGFYTSASFYVCLAVAIIVAAVIGFCGKRLKPWGLICTAFFLFMLFWPDLEAIAFLAIFTIVSTVAQFHDLKLWKAIRAEEDPDAKKALQKSAVIQYRIGLACTLVPLVACKVSAVFDANVLGFVGISYLTFKAVQAQIETRDGLIEEMSLSDYLYFLLFFPVITSGPIDRSRRFIEDASKVYTRAEYADLLTRGILLLLMGATFQLGIATMLNECFGVPAYDAANPLYSILMAGRDAWFYGLYMFFDFAGYSMMAIGASYCLGIKTPRNFRAPFAALDMKDFWNRWHITLSFWLRDFVFMRFVRWATKAKVFGNRLQTACCGYVVNMFLMGAWHGLTLDYLLYGLYHGVLLAATDAFQKKSKFYKAHKNSLWFKLVSWFITLNLVMFGFALFSGQFTHFLGGIING